MRADIASTSRYEGLKVTREEYLNLEDDGFKYDMIDGVLHVPPSGTYEHGNSQSRISYELRTYLKKRPVGEVATEVDVFLPDGGDMLRPDLNFILHENLGIVKKHIHGTPDLVCEILSDSTAERDLGVKAERYLKNGVREYWILDPRDRTIRLWINRAGKSWEKRAGESLASKLLPGFVLNAAEFFA